MFDFLKRNNDVEILRAEFVKTITKAQDLKDDARVSFCTILFAEILHFKEKFGNFEQFTRLPRDEIILELGEAGKGTEDARNRTRALRGTQKSLGEAASLTRHAYTQLILALALNEVKLVNFMSANLQPFFDEGEEVTRGLHE